MLESIQDHNVPVFILTLFWTVNMLLLTLFWTVNILLSFLLYSCIFYPQSFFKLFFPFVLDFSQVRRNLDQAKTLLEALIKVLILNQFQAYWLLIKSYVCIWSNNALGCDWLQREEKKRDVLECEVSLQRIQMKYKVYLQFILLFASLFSYSFQECLGVLIYFNLL